jgi:predicted O-linked N-acetylglucosamine transferase (SPINDLY family)
MHATSYLAAGLFEAHDRKRFEVIGVSLGANDKSSMRERVVKAFDRFEDVHGQANETIIRRIRDLNVDIAIDLNGFKRNARPAVFLNRVAPIQVNFLVFPGTSGMKTMDYIIADRFIATEDLRRNVSEKMVLLPNCYQANDDKKEIAEYTPRRDEEGLPPAGFVFCSFNQARKITPQMFDVWMRVLRDVPDSVLWLLSAAPAVIANLRASAERRSIDGQRLVFADHRPLDQHLARIRLADLFLDTFPCNAHTTASDALWAGCPVVTLTGNTFASRVCGSLLTTIGLPELSVETLKEYEELVLRLARHPQELQILKGRLAGNRLTSPLFDTKRFCLNLERAYEEMSRLARMGKAPEDIDVLETG